MGSGLPYNTPIDIWSFGCVIYEIFTGQILFPGDTNNKMLYLIMNIKGPFPKKMLRKGEFVERHFDNSDSSTPFLLLEEDFMTKRPVKRIISNITVKKNFSQMISWTKENRVKVLQLADLLEKLTMLDPEKRLTPTQALKYPFCETNQF